MKRALYLYSHNVKFFYSLVSVLKENKIGYRPINEADGFRPKTWALVVTTTDELSLISKNEFSKFLAIDPEADMEVLLLRILAELNDEINQKKIVLSIDPGAEFNGIAVILGGFSIYTTILYEIQDLLPFIHLVIGAFPNYTKFTIKVGDGVKNLMEKVLDTLCSGNLSEKMIEIEIVDERNTSKKRTKIKGKKHRSIDENAAIAIGHRKGTAIKAKKD
jgi:hypothetical protein